MKNCDTCRNSGTVPAPNGFEPCPECDPSYFTDLTGERIRFRYPKGPSEGCMVPIGEGLKVFVGAANK